MAIVGFAGKKGHGKDTAASALIELGWKKVAFADALYEEVAQSFGVSVEFLQNRTTKETPLPELTLCNCLNQDYVSVLKNLHYANLGLLEKVSIEAKAFFCGYRVSPLDTKAPLSPRQVLQTWGSDYRRRNNPDYWIEKLEHRLMSARDANWVVPDVRFPNEVELLKRMGAKIIRVTRPAAEACGEIDQHISENSITAQSMDKELVNQGTMSALKDSVRDFCKAEGLLS